MKLMHMGSSSCWGHWGKQPQHWVCKCWGQQDGGIPAVQSEQLTHTDWWLCHKQGTSSPGAWDCWASELRECSGAGDLGVSQSQATLVWGTPILHHWKQLLRTFKKHTRFKSSPVCLHLTPMYPSEQVSTSFLSPRHCTRGWTCAYHFLLFLCQE